MIRRPQSKIGGSLGKEIDALWDAVAAAQVNSVAGGKVDRTSSGTTIKFDAVDAEGNEVDLINVDWPDPFTGVEQYPAAVAPSYDPVTGLPQNYPDYATGYRWQTSAPVDLNQSWLMPLEQTAYGRLTGRTMNAVACVPFTTPGGFLETIGDNFSQHHFGQWPSAILATGSSDPATYFAGWSRPASGWDENAGIGHGGNASAIIPSGSSVGGLTMNGGTLFATGPQLTTGAQYGSAPFIGYDKDWTPIDWTDGAVDLTSPGLMSTFNPYPISAILGVPPSTEIHAVVNLRYALAVDSLDPSTGYLTYEPRYKFFRESGPTWFEVIG